jgi:hypothetical protein
MDMAVAVGNAVLVHIGMIVFVGHGIDLLHIFTLL